MLLISEGKLWILSVFPLTDDSKTSEYEKKEKERKETDIVSFLRNVAQLAFTSTIILYQYSLKFALEISDSL